MKTDNYITGVQTECLKAVQRINNEMHDKEGWENHSTQLTMSICSYHFYVKLNIDRLDCEITLFNSSSDDRIYYEKSDKYEEFYTFLKRKYRDVKTELNSIKL